MKKIILLVFLIGAVSLNSQVRYSFMQANNINTVFTNRGYYNYDKWTFPGGNAGFVWPASANQRLTAVFSTGLYLLGKVNGSYRSAGALYSSQFSGGNIPVIGQVPPASVCTDSAFKVYLVSTTDQSLLNGGVRNYNAGGRQYTLNFTSWAGWPVSQGAPYVEVNNIPGYQPGWSADRPGIGNGSTARPDQLLFTVYMDYTNCTNNIHSTEIGLPGGTPPLGAEIQQIIFAFNSSSLDNSYFIKYMIINKSSSMWDSVYFSLANDADLGNATDDAGGSDSARALTYVYNSDNQDINYGANPPAFGSTMLQSPLKYTGVLTDTVKLPYGTLTGYKFIYQTSSIILVCGNNCYCYPSDLDEALYLQKGLNACGSTIINPVTGQPTKFRYSGNGCTRNGWFDSASGDRYSMQSSGPFTINSGDTQIVVFSFNITRDGGNNFENICSLQKISDSTYKHYYDNFIHLSPIGINPISTEVPDRFMLYQNYPNPFNPSTKIKFSIPLSGGFSIIIYDALGQEITTLVNENLTPGTYEIDWDGTNYSSGVYYYILTIGDASAPLSISKKMILMK